MFRYEPPPAWPPWCANAKCNTGGFRWIIKDEVNSRDWLLETSAMDTIELRPVQGPLCRENDGMYTVCVHESCNTIEINAGQPCMGCGWEYNCPDCQDEEEYNRYLDERVSRLGPELAMLPDLMPCYECGREHLMVMTDSWGFKYVPRRPVGLGPVAEAHRDPTQTYRVECGHITM
jgi:hypothetical protein